VDGAWTVANDNSTYQRNSESWRLQLRYRPPGNRVQSRALLYRLRLSEEYISLIFFVNFSIFVVWHVYSRDASMPVNSVIGRCSIDLFQKILLKWTLKCLNENCKAESAHIMYLIVSHILCGLASVFHPTISIFCVLRRDLRYLRFGFCVYFVRPLYWNWIALNWKECLVDFGWTFLWGLIERTQFINFDRVRFTDMSVVNGVCLLNDIVIVERIKHTPFYRPPLPPKDCEGVHPGILTLMKQCWAEEPSERPSFDEIARSFKIINNGKLALLLLSFENNLRFN